MVRVCYPESMQYYNTLYFSIRYQVPRLARRGFTNKALIFHTSALLPFLICCLPAQRSSLAQKAQNIAISSNFDIILIKILKQFRLAFFCIN